MPDDERTTEDIIEDGESSVDDRGVSGTVRAMLVGGSLAAFTTTIVQIVTGIPGTFLAPLRAFADGLATLIGGTIGAPVIVTDAGAESAADSFLTGLAGWLGPFTFPVAVLSSVAGIYIFIRFLQAISISPLQLIRDDAD